MTHPFKGSLDRYCEICQESDRHPNHKGHLPQVYTSDKIRSLIDAAVNNESWARKLTTELQISKPDFDMIGAIFTQILFAHGELISQYLQALEKEKNER